MAQITLNSTGVASNGSLVLQSNGTTAAVTIDTSQRVAFVAGTVALPAITTTGDTNTGIFFPAADTIAFTEGGAEAARFDSAGNLLVGATATSAYFDARANFYSPNTYSAFGGKQGGSSGDSVSTIWHAATSGDNIFQVFATETSPITRGSISYNRAGGLVAYNTTSDYRAKDINGPINNSGALIDSVPVYMGTMKGATQERPMFIAHETPAYAHTGEKDAVDADGNPVYQQMDTSSLVPVMWAEIQSLRKRLAALESA